MTPTILRKFWWLIVVSVTVVSVLLIFYFTSNLFSITACPENLSDIFTVSLINPKQISAINPLGWTNGMDHILPVDHASFITNNNGDAVSPRLPVYSPGNITITKLSSHVDYDANGNPYSNTSNYMIDATICRGVTIWIEGIHDLSPTLQNIFNKSDKKYSEAPLNAGAKAINYDVVTNYRIKAGELLGWTGGYSPQDSIAISAWNDNLKPRSDVDFSYYSDPRASVVCFADLYSGELKDALYNKFGYFDVNMLNFIPRTTEPKCGQVIQDIVGTIQGDWFANKPVQFENLQSEGKTISFIHDNVNSSIAVISVGDTITPGPETVVFLPIHSGNINREFSETKTNETYCFQDDSNQTPGVQYARSTGSKIIVQLLDDRHIKIENQFGNCTGNENFMNPFYYQR